MFTMKSHHVALKTPNFEAMKKFYTETLHMPIKGTIPGTPVVFIDCVGTTIEMSPTDDELCACPPCGFVHMAFEVEDVDAAAAELKEQGVVFTVEPKTVKDIRLCFFEDPDGNAIELFKSPTITW